MSSFWSTMRAYPWPAPSTARSCSVRTTRACGSMLSWPGTTPMHSWSIARSPRACWIKCSFAFRVTRPRLELRSHAEDDPLVNLDRGDVSIVNFGASPTASVDARRSVGVRRSQISVCTRPERALHGDGDTCPTIPTFHTTKPRPGRLASTSTQNGKHQMSLEAKGVPGNKVEIDGEWILITRTSSRSQRTHG